MRFGQLRLICSKTATLKLPEPSTGTARIDSLFEICILTTRCFSTLFRPASWAEAAAGVTRLSRPLMRGKVRTMRAKLRETFSLSQDHMLAADVVMMKAHRVRLECNSFNLSSYQPFHCSQSNAKVHGAAAKSVRAQVRILC